jgi:gliding motility-associated-like protein
MKVRLPNLILVLLLCPALTRAQVVAQFAYPDTVCLGSPVTLTNTSTGATTYNWVFSGTIPSSTAANPPAYTYSTAGVSSVCLTVDQGLPTAHTTCHNIVALPAPAIPFGIDTFFCAGQTVTLNAPKSPGIQNAWNTGSDSAILTVTLPGSYTLNASYYGCSLSRTTTVTELANPSLELPKDTVFCDSGVLRYTTTQPVTYIWNTGSTADTALVTSSGLYWLQLNERGCTALDTIVCKVIPTHSMTLGNDTSFCGPGLLRYVSADTTRIAYAWSTGSDSASTPVPATGTYSLTFTDAGCAATASIRCTVIPQPSVTLPVDTVFCDSGMLRYVSPLPVKYSWNTGYTGDSLPDVKFSGRYKLTIDNNGCTAVDSTQVTVVETPTVTLPADTSFCGPGALQYLSPLPVTYTWSTGATTPRTSVPASGLYQLVVSNSGCTATGSTQAVVLPVPVVNLGDDTAVCLTKPWVLDAGNPGDTYLWQDGSNQETYPVTQPGVYTVTVTQNGCSAASTIRIGAADIPYVSLGSNLPICPGEAIALKPSPDTTAYTYTWQDGSEDTVYKVTAPGTYSVTATDACSSYTAVIQVAEGICVVHVPNGFTPNGDGINDVFRVLGTEVVDEFSLLVFNRWGVKVYDSTDKDSGWDGTLRGKPQPSGTYAYELHFRYALTGQKYVQQGTVVLLR